MTFNTLADVPAPIRDFYTDKNGPVELIPFGVEMTQAEFDAVMIEQAGQLGGTLAVKAACALLEVRLARQFHDAYIDWMSSEPIEPVADPNAPVDPIEYYDEAMIEWREREPLAVAKPSMVVDGEMWGVYNHGAQRQILLAAAQVTVDGLVFNAGVRSSGRMSRTIARMEADAIPSIVWTLADGSSSTVTLAQLKTALQLATDYQSSIE